ncbi:unnamed protein product [Paramecium primaurelia]|uniref:Uncharacterized protein n=1 Tax=Paramecium primaurelia TaxID=5886 RepID=A0A8S1NAM8_PARPR|nr:unnamed protein product [Paramecium primaurelia]
MDYFQIQSSRNNTLYKIIYYLGILSRIHFQIVLSQNHTSTYIPKISHNISQLDIMDKYFQILYHSSNFNINLVQDHHKSCRKDSI